MCPERGGSVGSVNAVMVWNDSVCVSYDRPLLASKLGPLVMVLVGKAVEAMYVQKLC